MFRSALRAAAVPLLLLAIAPSASAEPVRPALLRVHSDGRIDSGRDLLPADPAGGRGGDRRIDPSAAVRAAASNAFPWTVGRMKAARHISAAAAADAVAAWTSAVRTDRKLHGLPRYELANVIGNVTGIVNRQALSASRLPAIVLMLKRNTQFFGAGRSPTYHQRVQFDGSDIVWQYYPGQGLEMQVLATFGVANGLWQAHMNGHFRALLDEMRGLAVKRAGGLAWEYMFSFDGGSPPWTSAMSQATGIQALARGSQRLQEPKYLATARAALKIFSKSTPSGVRSQTSRGPWYVMYSFDSSGRILNGFLQTLIGLQELVLKANDATAKRLFKAAEPVARAALPRYMSSGWSYYEPGVWSDESYHELTTGFLEKLCDRTGIKPYCRAEKRFAADSANAPQVKLATARAKAGTAASLRLWVSKPATISITVLSGKRRVHAGSSTFSPGWHTTTGFRVPRAARGLSVAISASDPSGHKRKLAKSLKVSG